jgi:hypothetical protein
VEKNHKIIVIGDSHARGCARDIKVNIDEGFDVQGFIKYFLSEGEGFVFHQILFRQTL